MKLIERGEGSLPITFHDVQSAAEGLAGVANRTPVLSSRETNQRVGAEVFFKCENLQRAGAFKFRGAYNRLSRLTESERKRGVVAFSSGNHAQGVALAARVLGIKSTIVMPSDAPAIKLAATRGYGAQVVLYDRQSEDREAIARRFSKEEGMTLVPPYDDPFIMAGQGTAALELFEQAGTLDLLLVPVGGGGLLSGCATVARAVAPHCRVVGVETLLSNDWEQSFLKGERVRIPVPATIADGMRTQQPGVLTWEVVRATNCEIATVSDEEVIQAMLWLLLRLKVLVEPTGAVPLALLLSGRLHVPDGGRIGVLLSGGNVDPETLATALAASSHS